MDNSMLRLRPTDEPLNILCVDDEEGILKSLKRLFHRESFGVLTATSGESGLALLKQMGNIGLILSDQRMPGMSGVVFLEAARALAPHVPRMIMTGYADMESISDAMNRGDLLRYLHKPWDDDELRLAVHDGLRRYRATAWGPFCPGPLRRCRSGGEGCSGSPSCTRSHAGTGTPAGGTARRHGVDS